MLATVSRAPLLIGRVAALLRADVVRLEVRRESLPIPPFLQIASLSTCSSRAFRARVITVSRGGRPNPDT